MPPANLGLRELDSVVARPRRTQAYVAVPGGQCCTVLDVPAVPARTLVVCAHGLTGDRSGPGSLLARWAASLAAQGFAVVRFDFRGSGDSTGNFAETDVDGMLSDYTAVADWARSELECTSWVAAGISVGGVIAALASAAAPQPTGVLLLSSDLYEAPPAGLSPVDIREGEFQLHTRFTKSREKARPRAALAGFTGPKGLIFGAADEEVTPEVNDLVRMGIESVMIPRCGHLFESDASRQALLSASLNFLRRLPNA